MEEFLRDAFALLVKSTLILGIAWALASAFRRRAAALRHVVWCTAFVALILLPIGTAWLPAVQIEVPRYQAVSNRVLAPILIADQTTNGGQAATGLSSDATALASSVDDRAESANGIGLSHLIFIVWLIGVGGTLLVTVVHLVRARRAMRKAVPSSRVCALAEEVATRLSLHVTPRVVVGGVFVPMVWGIRRPVTLLPADAVHWGDDRLRIILLHEFAHVRRLDYVSRLLAELACLLYWPNPLVWMARRRMSLEQERACDDIVLSTGTAPFDYAESLLDIARRTRSPKLTAGGLSMAAKYGLKERVRAILDPTAQRRTTTSKLSAVAVLAVTVPALCMAAFQAGGPAQKEASPDGARSDLAAKGTSIFAEAEDADLHPPMILKTDDDASGGTYVVVPDGEGNDPPSGGPGRVTFKLDLQNNERHFVWARVVGQAGNDNSFFVAVDGNSEFRWDVLDRDGQCCLNRWKWLRVSDRAGHAVPIEGGLREITFRNREDGTKLDAIFVTADPNSRPSGQSPEPSSTRPHHVTLEAEQPAYWSAPLEMRADDDASGRLYLAAAHGRTSRDQPPQDGRAVYRMNISQPGTYMVWARVIAPDDDEDSFWIRTNTDSWVRWNGIGHGDDWSWQLVRDADDGEQVAAFRLGAGSNQLEFAYREDGAKLDQLVVTNDPNTHPSQIAPARSDVKVILRD